MRAGQRAPVHCVTRLDSVLACFCLVMDHGLTNAGMAPRTELN